MLREANVPVFTSPSRAAKSLGESILRYHQRRRKFLGRERRISSWVRSQRRPTAVAARRPDDDDGARRQDFSFSLGNHSPHGRFNPGA